MKMKQQRSSSSTASDRRSKQKKVRRRTPEEAKSEIIAVARDLLKKHSFRDLTVDKLMQRTQIGRSAFYAYFDTVYDIAEIFIHELALKIESGSIEWFDKEGDTAERIRNSLSNAIDFWLANGAMIRALEEATALDSRLQKIWRDKISMIPIHRVADAIQRDQAAGLIVPLDAYEMSLALNRFNITYLNDAFGHERKKDPAVALETLKRVWFGTLYGFSSSAPRKAKRQPPASKKPSATRRRK